MTTDDNINEILFNLYVDSSKFIDNTAIIQVVGNVFKNPKLLDDTDKYSITEDDFPDRFHKIVFGAIYKIYELGANKITLENISDFLSSRPKSEAVWRKCHNLNLLIIIIPA